MDHSAAIVTEYRANELTNFRVLLRLYVTIFSGKKFFIFFDAHNKNNFRATVLATNATVVKKTVQMTYECE